MCNLPPLWVWMGRLCRFCGRAARWMERKSVHMRRKLKKRLGAGALALCLFTMAPLHVTARTIAEIEAQQSELQAEQESLQAQLEQLRNDEAQKQEYQETLQKQIDVVEGQIDTAIQDIEDLNRSIKELTMKLDKSEEEMGDTIQAFRERVVALYKAGSVNTLQILLDSTSLSDFTARSELLNAMSRKDKELVDKITAYMEATDGERRECEEKKAKVAELKKGLEQKQEELDGLYEENLQAIADLQGAQAATQSTLQRNQEELDANEAEIAALIEAQRKYEEEQKRLAEEAAAAAGSGGGGGGSISYPTGGGGVAGFNPIWPLPGVSYISAGYNGYPGHKGLDIAGPYGTAVVAAESGTVIEANSTDSWGMSWGYYVLIYHNGTYTTRYAHLSSVAVSKGQYVSAGQIVGYEGATGNVTGPHLHFEVYQNGTRVDPMAFL